MRIGDILSGIDNGAIALPVFQRGFVWNRTQVRKLVSALYRRNPVGSLLTWKTRTEVAAARGDKMLQAGTVDLLLDGQQRITSLYGIVRGEEPPFFEGDKSAFTNLYFNVPNEEFQFYAPVRMEQEQGWVSVTSLMKEGIASFIPEAQKWADSQDQLAEYIARLSRLKDIAEVDLYIDTVTGEDKTVDVVVDIFNEVNSNGTKLSKGDLALAKLCSAWPDARQEMHTLLHRWRGSGFTFKLDWLLRCANAMLTGEALFSALDNVEVSRFRDSLPNVEKRINRVLNMIMTRLELDHARVLGSPNSFPVMVRYLDQRGGVIPDPVEQSRLLYWYVHSLLWGRYSGSAETTMNQDLQAIEDESVGAGNLIDLLRRSRGDLTIRPEDFLQWSKGARFYPLLYMLTRANGAKDWCTGIELSSKTIGKNTNLELHHIFPKSVLYAQEFERSEVNALANFTFLTQECNARISNRLPEEYMPEVLANQPDALESHWIPNDPELWKVENYRRFLEARRKLLAEAANAFLGRLYETATDEQGSDEMESLTVAHTDVASGADDEDSLLLETNVWVIDNGFPEGEFGYQLVDDESQQLIATLDLAWPDGLQSGLSTPVALLVDEEPSVERIASSVGFRVFTSPEGFRAYVERELVNPIP